MLTALIILCLATTLLLLHSLLAFLLFTILKVEQYVMPLLTGFRKQYHLAASLALCASSLGQRRETIIDRLLIRICFLQRS